MTSHSEPQLPLAREHQDSEKRAEQLSDPGSALDGVSSDVDDDTTDDAHEDASDQDSDEEENPVSRDPRRPAFIDELPESELLDPLVAAFVDGNYAHLRELERALAKDAKDPEILEAARELVARTEPDPLSKKLLGLSILFFVLVVGWVYFYHAH
ncbi:MAG TPA: hypothetical protein VKP30_19585 [Polyangiaceae bacterium]|nr:hypothetical protein [Polyangiaceae bacterium]